MQSFKFGIILVSILLAGTISAFACSAHSSPQMQTGEKPANG